MRLPFGPGTLLVPQGTAQIAQSPTCFPSIWGNTLHLAPNLEHVTYSECTESRIPCGHEHVFTVNLSSWDEHHSHLHVVVDLQNKRNTRGILLEALSQTMPQFQIEDWSVGFFPPDIGLECQRPF